MRTSEWLEQNLKFAQQPGLNLDEIGKKVAAYLRASGHSSFSNGDMLRALRVFRYEFSEISKREKELNVSFMEIVHRHLLPV